MIMTKDIIFNKEEELDDLHPNRPKYFKPWTATFVIMLVLVLGILKYLIVTGVI